MRTFLIHKKDILELLACNFFCLSKRLICIISLLPSLLFTISFSWMLKSLLCFSLYSLFNSTLNQGIFLGAIAESWNGEVADTVLRVLSLFLCCEITVHVCFCFVYMLVEKWNNTCMHLCEDALKQWGRKQLLDLSFWFPITHHHRNRISDKRWWAFDYFLFYIYICFNQWQSSRVLEGEINYSMDSLKQSTIVPRDRQVCMNSDP